MALLQGLCHFNILPGLNCSPFLSSVLHPPCPQNWQHVDDTANIEESGYLDHSHTIFFADPGEILCRQVFSVNKEHFHSGKFIASVKQCKMYIKCYLGECVDIFKYEIMLSDNRDNMTFSFLLCILLFLFLCITGLFKALNTILIIKAVGDFVLFHCL